jgi:hypothetical protein
VGTPAWPQVTLAGILSGSVTAIVFAGVVLLVDRRDAGPLLARLRRLARPRRAPQPAGTPAPGPIPDADEDRRADGRDA